MSELPETRFTRVDDLDIAYQASEVLVTSTVQMLVLGSGIGFADRGRHKLKGVPDQWQLPAVEHT